MSHMGSKGAVRPNPERVRSYLSKQTSRRPAGAAPSCHVWTAPAAQGGGLTFCEAFGCSHVSGL
jgi:hypothetical protein